MWSAILTTSATATSAVSRYSEASHAQPADHERVGALAREGSAAVSSLAAAVVIGLGGWFNRNAVPEEAERLVDEIEEQGNGLLHATNGMAKLLRARLAHAGGEVELTWSLMDDATATILSALVAQEACLLRHGRGHCVVW